MMGLTAALQHAPPQPPHRMSEEARLAGEVGHGRAALAENGSLGRPGDGSPLVRLRGGEFHTGRRRVGGRLPRVLRLAAERAHGAPLDAGRTPNAVKRLWAIHQQERLCCTTSSVRTAMRSFHARGEAAGEAMALGIHGRVGERGPFVPDSARGDAASGDEPDAILLQCDRIERVQARARPADDGIHRVASRPRLR
jgi:hypothetical protein